MRIVKIEFSIVVQILTKILLKYRSFEYNIKDSNFIFNIHFADII